jgi:hypothetical protein
MLLKKGSCQERNGSNGFEIELLMKNISTVRLVVRMGFKTILLWPKSTSIMIKYMIYKLCPLSINKMIIRHFWPIAEKYRVKSQK